MANTEFPNLVFVPSAVDLDRHAASIANSGAVVREPLAQPLNLTRLPAPGPQLWPVKS